LDILIQNYMTLFIINIILNYLILNMSMSLLNGERIIKELVEKVFHPSRLLNICNKYNIDFIDLMDIY